jgi:ADP-ribosylarginine hydrolase
MILSAVGDAMGFKHGSWEFDYDGEHIHRQLAEITNGIGISELSVDKEFSIVSDDTIMAIATAKASYFKTTII